MRLILFSNKKKAFVASFLFSFFLTILFVQTKSFIAGQLETASYSTQSQAEVLSASEEKISPQVDTDLTTLTILLVGYGGVGHQGGYLTDAIQVLYLNFDKRKIALISIPRDLWVRLPNGQEAKVNTVLLTGSQKTNLVASGAENLKSVVLNILGLKVDYFVGIDFVGFQRAIGIELKGIEVEVGEVLDDPWYPITGEELNTCGKTSQEVAELTEKYSGFELERQFPCRYEYIHFDKGIVHMEGGDALKYVRSRHGSSKGDISRGRRQQEVLKAIAQKLFSLNALDNIPVFYDSLTKHVSTDTDLESIKYLAPLLKSLWGIEVININLSTDNVLSLSSTKLGQSILIPKEGIGKWDKVRSFIEEQI